MIVETKKDAQRIAYFGMQKMLREGGYALSQGKSSPRLWWVDKEGGNAYLVTLGTPTVPASCDCLFFKNNERHGVCKHLYFVQHKIKEQEEEAARQAEEDSYWIRMYDNGEGPEGCLDHPHVPGLGF